MLLGEAAGVPANQSYELYQMLEPQLREAGLQPAYAVEQDMDLRMHGIRPETATDASSLAKMEQMGYAYYLRWAVGNQAAGLGYTSVSAGERQEVQQFGGKLESGNTKASVTFELYSTQTRKLVYTLTATTEMAGLTVPNKDQENGHRGSSSVNVSTISMAVSRASLKDVKRLLENCSCCHK
ncbi:hypothetical protein [Pontibacter chinhatensis]|uniref:hypothetical protein n=1 Tax=Pontibacter chinhatensis TaxID=1436961 RepID=UPI001113E48F|nr:hypothetical protein [Pontibacter chinhatensis]